MSGCWFVRRFGRTRSPATRSATHGDDEGGPAPRASARRGRRGTLAARMARGRERRRSVGPHGDQGRTSFRSAGASVRLAPVRPPDTLKDPAMISLQHVTKVYRNGVTALEDVTVEVEKGEFVFIVGPVRLGQVARSSASCSRRRRRPRARSTSPARTWRSSSPWKVPHLRRNIGTVFQDFKLLQDKTVFENVAFALEVIGKPKHVIDQRVPEILELRGARRQAQQLPRRALRRRAAARLDRAGVREPAARAPGRRADRATSTPAPRSTSCGCSTR